MTWRARNHGADSATVSQRTRSHSGWGDPCSGPGVHGKQQQLPQTAAKVLSALLAGHRVSRSRISHAAAGAWDKGGKWENVRTWGEMRGNGGKWGETRGNGGKWGEMGTCEKLHSAFWVMYKKRCEINGKQEEHRIKTGQFGTISPFPRGLTTFPSGSVDEFCRPS